jgi:hypothetical protein
MNNYQHVQIFHSAKIKINILEHFLDRIHKMVLIELDVLYNV